LDPGESADDAIVITNRSGAAIDLSVYARDALTTLDGNLDLQPAAAQPAGLGAWITLEAHSVAIGPGESATVPFRVQVPDDAGPGDYGGGIVTSLAADAAAGTVAVDRRLALRAFVRVGGDLSPRIAVQRIAVQAGASLNPFATATAKVRAEIANTGNARLVPTASVEVAGPFGWLPVSGPIWVGEEILPGSVIVQEFDVPNVRLLGRLSARITLTAAAQGVGGIGLDTEATGQAATWAVPWSGLVVAVMIGVAAWWAARRRTMPREEGAPPRTRAV
jgi:hypothetical protein